ncbi:acyl dehydratase [Sphingobium sp. Sx8-8]|uniref:MaoC family dehydratase n=1 Tax=Sphingobium sp. Sx8-8 TaxID=2933617 RepID=UPI001F58861D|nr:acyl dehydratase [Sphingobium sp. Sx8-8]
MNDTTTITQLGRGPYWQEVSVGDKFRTYERTITETDLVSFINVTGMLETQFTASALHAGPIQGRLIPAALTYGIIEGFQFQSLIQGVGLALLDVAIKAHAPVRVGDTIHAIIEVTLIKPTSKGNRAIVASEVKVFNQDDLLVLSYVVTRMVAGKPE